MSASLANSKDKPFFLREQAWITFLIVNKFLALHFGSVRLTEILLLILILFVFGTVVSVYHVGIEQGIFSESLLCELGGSNKVQNTDELLKTLENTPISCKEVTFTIFGLSLATFNAVLSSIISIILLKLIIKNE